MCIMYTLIVIAYCVFSVISYAEYTYIILMFMLTYYQGARNALHDRHRVYLKITIIQISANFEAIELSEY